MGYLTLDTQLSHIVIFSYALYCKHSRQLTYVFVIIGSYSGDKIDDLIDNNHQLLRSAECVFYVISCLLYTL